MILIKLDSACREFIYLMVDSRVLTFVTHFFCSFLSFIPWISARRLLFFLTLPIKIVRNFVVIESEELKGDGVCLAPGGSPLRL